MRSFSRATLFLLLSGLIAGCTGSSGGPSSPAPPSSPMVTITIDGGGQVLHNGEICTQAESPCHYPAALGESLLYSVFPTDNIAFYSWQYCATPQGTKCTQTVTGSVNILAHFGPIITVTPNPPPDPILALSDPVTGSQITVRQNSASVAITSDATAVKWCLSETQASRPTSGTDTCSGTDSTSNVDSKGWYKSRPTSVNLSSGDGTKTVYLWVANVTNDVNLLQVSASIGVNTQLPAIPTVTLQDTATGSMTSTSLATVNMNITQDTNAAYWCIYEQSSSAAQPASPAYNANCWVNAKPNQITLGALGLRSVYVFTKSLAQNISSGPGIATINYASPLPELTLDAPAAFEGSPVTFTVTQSFSSTTTTTVHYATVDGTAVAGVNYSASSGTATIPAGQISTTIVINTIDDHIHTPNKKFSLSISSANNASISANLSSATLYDIDAGPVMSLGSTSSVEGQPLIFTVTQSSISAFDSTFQFTTSDGSAVNGVNYTQTSGSFTIPAGQISATVQVPTLDDGIYTPNLTVLVNISNATGATLGTSRSLGIINNNDAIPTLSIATSAVTEGQKLTFTVTQSTVTGFDTVFKYTTSDNSAVAGTNYNAASGLITILQGQTTANFQVSTIDAGIYAPDKQVMIVLSSPAHATIPSPTILATIKNNHSAPGVSIISASAVKGSNLKFTVIQNQVTGYATTFSYKTSDGTAIDGSQYTARSGTATIPIGAQTVEVDVPTLDDGVFTLAKNMTITISNPQYAVISVPSATGVIVSAGGASLSVADAPAVEGDNLSFNITLSSALQNDVHIDYATGDDTAIGGFNYVVGTGSVIIPAGSTSVAVNVATLHDGEFSLDQKMKFFLIGSPDAPIAQNIGVGTITNIDPMPSLTISNASSDEGNDLVFIVTQSAISEADTSFTFVLGGGTAVQGINYNYQGSGGSIPAGQLSTSIHIPTLDNGFFGPNVTVDMTLASSTNATIASALGIGSIINTFGTPVISISNSSAIEGRPLQFQISLSALSIIDTTVQVQTGDGSAVQFKNYFSNSQTVTIPAGQQTATFSVSTVDSGVYGPNLEMVVNMSNATGSNLGTSNAIGTILNNHGIPYLSLPINFVTTNEGQSLQFLVTQSNTTQNVTTFQYKTTDGTATAPNNYIETFGTATIAAGQTTAIITVPTVDANLYNIDKQMSIQIFAPVNALIDPNFGVMSGIIKNIDSIPVISIPEISAVEGTDFIFTANLSAPSGLDSSFLFSTADGTALANTNYIPGSAPLFIPAGQTSTQFAVSTLDDHVYTPTTHVGIVLTRLVNVAAPGPYVGDITNNDSPPNISISDTSGNEGTPIVFTITQDNVSGFDTTFNYSTSDGTAVSGPEYTATSGSAVIKAGQTSVTFSVPTFDEGVYAAVKKFNASISSAVNANINKGSSVATITNNHSAPTLSIGSAEGPEGSNLVFTVTQSTLSGLDTTFSYTTVDGTAVTGTNYTKTFGTATIPAGSTSVQITVSTSDDFLNDGALLMSVLLSSPVNANLANSSGLGTIDNIDGTPNVSVANVKGNEGDNLIFTVTSSSVSGAPVSVSYATSDGTAVAGTDYSSSSGTVTIPAGQTTVTVSVSTVHDGLYSLSKTLTFTISSPVNANIIQATSTATILNIDPMPTLTIANASASDGQPLFFVASLSSISKIDTIVNYQTVDGTAITPQDYAASQGTLIIPAGQTTSNIVFLTYDLKAYGQNLYMGLQFSAVVNAILGTSQATGTIVNHYPPPAVSLAVADAQTASYTLTNNQVVQVQVGTGYAVKWCLSASALGKPVNGTVACIGGASGANVNNGWYTTVPTSFTMPVGDGLKTVYMWISDDLNKVSDASSAQITLDTSIPVTPIVSMSDPKTASKTLTNRSNPVLTITGDTGTPAAIDWCSIEQADGLSSPLAPLYNDPCWVSTRPTNQILGGLGQRDVFVFTKSLAQNISSAGTATINYSAQPPADPGLTLKDPTTASTLYARQNTANVLITGDASASKWCLSETQTTRPTSSSNPCAGGTGDTLGWYTTARPTTITLSPNDGLKKLYIWIVDDIDNVNLDAVTASITVDTVLPTISSIALTDPNTGSNSYTDQGTVSFLINNDIKASSWLVIGAVGSASPPTAPLFNDVRWSSTRPSTLVLGGPGLNKAFMWTMSPAQNISVVATSGTIDYETAPAQSVNFTLLDGATQSLSAFTSTTSTVVSVTPNSAVSRWCLSEIQISPPSLGTSLCLGGAGPANGWYTTSPTAYTLTSGDGAKTVYLWVANQYNNVSQTRSSDAITLNTTVPATPSITLSDPNTGSTTQTNQTVINLAISGDANAVGWCVFDQDKSVAAPTAPPIFSSSCWKSVRPSTVTLTATSIRNVYLYTRNNADTPSAAYATAQMDDSNQPPNNPTLGLSDPNTLSTTKVRQNSASVAITDLAVVGWCISETQKTKPATGTTLCAGGRGSANGWFTVRPSSISLSSGDGLKTVYLWVANSHNNVSTGTVSTTITVDTTLPVTPSIILNECPLSATSFGAATVQSCLCKASDTTVTNAIYGTGIYAYDSAICKAAVHAGIITTSGGFVSFIMLGNNSLFTGSTAHGITSTSYAPSYPSFQFSSPAPTVNLTTSATVGVGITGDTTSPAAVAWCTIEQLSTYVVPNSPNFDSSCWVTSRPTQQLLGAFGIRTVYVFTKSASQNVSLPGSASITYTPPPPPNPGFYMTDPATSSSTYARQNSVAQYTYTDTPAVLWCYSETQTTRPSSGSANCVGGSGSALGWYTQKPATFPLSAGEGLKTVYLWIADQYGNTNVTAVTATITVASVIPGTPVVSITDPNTGSTTLTNRNISNLSITNDTNANSYCLFEAAAGSQQAAPLYSDYCWYSYPNPASKPTTVHFYTAGNRQLIVYTKSIAGVVSLPGMAQTDFVVNGPADPTLAISDPVTGSTNYARQVGVKIVITNDLTAVKWCLSETQITVPASGSVPCVGGQGSSNGWYTSRPSTFNVSTGDGGKYVYIWIANSSGNVNMGFTATPYGYIDLVTIIPGTPTNFSVSDPITSSTSTTNQSSVNLTYTAQASDYYACLIEVSNTSAAPSAPAWNDPCWTYYPYQSTWSLKAQGQRQFYLFMMSYAYNIQTTPATATIFVQQTAPNNPTSYYIEDPYTGSQTIVRQHQAYAVFSAVPGVVKWCLSETQTTKPATGSSVCSGGLTGTGIVNGWAVTTAPNYFTLSAGDGLKTVYLWLADQFDNVNLVAPTASITMQTPIIPTTPIVSFKQNGVVVTTLTVSPAPITIQNDTNAVQWCVFENLQNQGNPAAPAASNSCWVTSRPTSWTFQNPHTPVYINVYTKSSTGDISAVGDVLVTYNKPPPATPALVLQDPLTGSTSKARQSSATATITGDTPAVKWCLSETQPTQPTNGNSACTGGAGADNGWFTETPTFISLSSGNNLKTVYLWIADAWNFTSTSAASATITVSPATIGTPTVSVADSSTHSTTLTSTGLVTVTVTGATGATAWCPIIIADGSGTPAQPLPTDACWISTSTFNSTLPVTGLIDVFVYAKDAAGNISATPGLGKIQFGAGITLITSSSVASGATSPFMSPIFSIANSAAYYTYKNANRAMDCSSNNDPNNQYSQILPNSSNITDNVINLLDGDIYLCVDPIQDPSLTPNYSLSSSYHWIKEALWKEKAFLKSENTFPGVAFGSGVSIWNNYFIVADDLDQNGDSGEYNGDIFIYSIASDNTVSLVTRLGSVFYTYGTQGGFGASFSISTTGTMAVIPTTTNYGYFYTFDLPSLVAGSPYYTNETTVYIPGGNTPGFTGVTGTDVMGQVVFDPVNPNQLAIGYPGAYGPTNNTVGGVAVYKYNLATSTWLMDSWYTTSETTVGASLIGTSVSFYNGTIVAGAPGQVTPIATGTTQTGAIYTWQVPSNSAGNTYTNPTILQGTTSTARGHEIGYNVAIYHDPLLNKNIIMAGDPKDSTNGTNSGVVYYWTQDDLGNFSLPPTKLFSQNSKITQAGTLFGSSIAIGGNHIVINAPGTSGSNTATTVWNYENGFVEKASLSSGISQYTGSGYGTSIAVSPEYILIGSPNDTTNNPVSTGVLISPPVGTSTLDVGGVSVFNGYQ